MCPAGRGRRSALDLSRERQRPRWHENAGTTMCRLRRARWLPIRCADEDVGAPGTNALSMNLESAVAGTQSRQSFSGRFDERRAGSACKKGRDGNESIPPRWVYPGKFAQGLIRKKRLGARVVSMNHGLVAPVRSVQGGRRLSEYWRMPMGQLMDAPPGAPSVNS